MGRIQSPKQGMKDFLAGLDALLRVRGSSIEWNYLNSGTHDSQRKHEFDRAAVSTIVAAALAMDRGLEAIRNG